PQKEEMAKRAGATDFVNSAEEDPVKAGKVKDGFDVVCEMSGAQAAITAAFKCVRSGGRITAFGIPSKKIELDWANDLIFKGVRVHGIVGREIFETWYKADRLLRGGAIDLKPVVTHQFPLKDFERGFAAMTAPSRDCGKVIFVP
ncbi:MAG: zinc-binding dehydrogenase, partial [Elusimicrobia bacterium]|nr:zinc-binding dehydrogenase [Elusimicrobiota bacterium]